MATLFSDDFESGTLAAWDGTVTSAGCSVAVNAASADAGVYGLDANKPTSNDNGSARAYKGYTAPASHVHSLRFRVKVVSRTGDGAMLFGWLQRDAPEYQAKAALYHDGTNWAIRGWQRDGTVGSVVLNTQLVVGTWYTVELVYDASGANPVVTCYLNGASAASFTDSTTGTVNEPTSVHVGLLELAWSQQAEAYYDTVVLADAVQGTGGPAKSGVAFTAALAGSRVAGTRSTWAAVSLTGQSRLADTGLKGATSTARVVGPASARVTSVAARLGAALLFGPFGARAPGLKGARGSARLDADVALRGSGTKGAAASVTVHALIAALGSGVKGGRGGVLAAVLGALRTVLGRPMAPVRTVTAPAQPLAFTAPVQTRGVSAPVQTLTFTVPDQ